MRISDTACFAVDWEDVPAVEYPGQTGTALVQTVERGNVRLRLAEYSAGYAADHWCSRGHVVLVIEGEVIIKLEDGRCFPLGVGKSFVVADDVEPHLMCSDRPAKLFVID